MPLKKSEIEKFKKALEDLRNQITRNLHDTTEDVKSAIDESSGYSQHQADEGTDNFDQTISLELTSKEYEVLRQIERAFEKIEDNTYGICDVTGEDIPKARLEAVPYATMTVKAQEQMEKGLL